MFQKGNKYGNGRPIGSLSSLTKLFQSKLKEHNYDHAGAFLDIYEKAMDTFMNGHPDDKMQGLKIALEAAERMASYVMPKLKSITVSTENPLEGLSSEQKLEALRQATLAYEREIKQVGNSSEVEQLAVNQKTAGSIPAFPAKDD